MRYLLTFSFLSILALLAGCSRENSATTPTENPVPDMSQAYDDAEKLLDRFVENNDGRQPEGAPTGVTGLPSLTDEGYDIYSVTFVWGWPFNIPQPQTDPIVWDGTLSVNAEAIVAITRTIDFEPGQDSVLPHDAVHFDAWVSQTDGDFDGFTALVFLKRGNYYFAPPLLTFDTEPFHISFDFGQLEDFTGLYVVGNTSIVAVRAARIWTVPCPKGTLNGTWEKDSSFAYTGYFSGFWLDHNNNPIGPYAGHFWRDDDNIGRFEGWVSGGLTAQVIIEFSGEWIYDDPRDCILCGVGHGQYWGEYKYLSRAGGGTLRGVFGDYSLPPDDLEMPMKGFWRDSCNAISIGNNSGAE